jgi:hypothetical protein
MATTAEGRPQRAGKIESQAGEYVAAVNEKRILFGGVNSRTRRRK